MSPRRRGHGRHGGGNSAGVAGAASPGEAAGGVGAVAPNEPNLAADQGAVPADSDAEDSAPSRNGVAHLNGNRPADVAQRGGPGSGGGPGGQRPGQRRPQRGRPNGATVIPAAAFSRPAAPASAVAASASAAPSEDEADGAPTPGRRPNCTLAQMRRFIKSRPYVPVHELRRRFEIEGLEDEVSPVSTSRGTIYVGLPQEQALFLGELIKSGDVGCEMLLDPDSPGVVGVFPMRPVARQ